LWGKANEINSDLISSRNRLCGTLPSIFGCSRHHVWVELGTDCPGATVVGGTRPGSHTGLLTCSVAHVVTVSQPLLGVTPDSSKYHRPGAATPSPALELFFLPS
jgi:hypothetical protein